MAYGQNMKAPMAGITGLAALKGRQGDNTLVHVNPMELKALDNMAPGGLTRNPYTGLPEAFKLKDILPALGAVAGAAFLPMMIPALAGGSALAAAGAAGLGGAAGTALAGGNREEILGSGLMSGATAGLGSYLSGAGKAATTADQTVGEMFAETGVKPGTQIPKEVLDSPASMMSSQQMQMLGSKGATAAKIAAPVTTALGRVGGLSGAATTGLAAMAPTMMQPPPEEYTYEGPTQSAITEMQARPNQPQAVDEFIRKGGAVPQFFDYRVTQPYIAAEGGQLGDAPRGEMFSGMVEGRGDGMSDEVAFDVVGDPEVDTAMLSPDEYVMDAHTVAALGNGSSDAGAARLDEFRKALREKVYGRKEQPNQINAEKELSKLS
jgi:hypothetical protein